MTPRQVAHALGVPVLGLEVSRTRSGPDYVDSLGRPVPVFITDAGGRAALRLWTRDHKRTVAIGADTGPARLASLREVIRAWDELLVTPWDNL